MFKRIQNKRRYQRARAEADKTDQMVSAVQTENGDWVYFTVPRDVEDHVVREKAFEIRAGRPMNKLEHQLNAIAGRGRT